MTSTPDSILNALRARAEASERFVETKLNGTTLQCRAKGIEIEAWYSVEFSENSVYVVLATPDRWLSESIEADLMHTGDSLEELIEEELIDLGVSTGEAKVAPVEHFRSDDFLYTFRSQVVDENEETISRWLLAYEAAFFELGNMGGDDET